jgi:hypothetical protein
MTYTATDMYNPELYDRLERWHDETMFLSGGWTIPAYLKDVSKKDVPALMSHLTSHPSWQTLYLLCEISGVYVPRHIQGMFWHQIAWRVDWWECVGDHIDWRLMDGVLQDMKVKE